MDFKIFLFQNNTMLCLFNLIACFVAKTVFKFLFLDSFDLF